MTHGCPRRSALLVIPLAFAGCSFLAPQPDASRFFSLAALAAPPVQPSGARRELTYGLGPIMLPAYLDRNEVAKRVSPTELSYSATDRWAEPLAANVGRVLLRNLSALLGTDRILVYPWSGDLAVDYSVEVQFMHFEQGQDGEADLVARWIIREGRSGALLTVRESRFTRPGSVAATADAISALSATLGDLSQEIAAALRELPPPPGSRSTHKQS